MCYTKAIGQVRASIHLNTVGTAHTLKEKRSLLTSDLKLCIGVLNTGGMPLFGEFSY